MLYLLLAQIQLSLKKIKIGRPEHLLHPSSTSDNISIYDQCINSPTKNRNYDTLVLTTVSIVVRKVGLTIHQSLLVYRCSYKKQDLRCTGFDQCINSPTKSRTKVTPVTGVSIILHKVGLRYTSFDQCIDRPIKSRTYDTRCAGLNQCINSPSVEQD